VNFKKHLPVPGIIGLLLGANAYAQEPTSSKPAHLQVRQADGTYSGAQLTPDELDKPGMVCIRFNNYWCVKAAGWRGQISKDSRGHAQFDTPASGAHTYRYSHNLKTANEIISRYAPSDDCVGSIGKPPNCPHGVNPVKDYAERIAQAAGKKPSEDLGLFDENGKINLKVAVPVFQAFSLYELSSDSNKYRTDADLVLEGIQAAGLQP
jgi:hypothetical protein